jgi:hypothetical protein
VLWLSKYCRQPVNGLRPDHILRSGEETMASYHDALCGEAESQPAETEETIIGGGWRRLLIRTAGWQWADCGRD